MRALLVALSVSLAPAPALAGFWQRPLLDVAAARAVVANGGTVEMALHVPDAPADLGRRMALLVREVDVIGEPAWQRGRQQAVCPLGVTPLGQGLAWVRVGIAESEALERVLGAGRTLVPLAPSEILLGTAPESYPPQPPPASWAPPAFSCAFAAGQREARWLYGDWDGDGVREVGKYVPALDLFLLDANANGLWDGVAGGDRSAWVAAAAGPGEPLVGDWNGDGVESVGKAIGATAWLDANESLGWEGRAGGDAVASVAPGRPDAMYVAGDWDGDGRDQTGRYEPGFGRFLLDANANGGWDGAAAGDRRVDFPFAGDPTLAGLEPFADDFDGAPGDGVGQAAPGRAVADLDEDGVFESTAGGDLDVWSLAWLLAGELPLRPPGDGSGTSGLFFPGYGAILQTVPPGSEIEEIGERD